MSKKNLDKLFQEKFKDFTDIPTEKVWKSIETSLDRKKKDRKVIPLWWKLSGIAAVLAIGLFLTNPFKNVAETNPTITNVENSKQAETDENGKEDIPQVTKSDTPKANERYGKDAVVSGNTEETTRVSKEQRKKDVYTTLPRTVTPPNRNANNTSLAVGETVAPIKKEAKRQNGIVSDKDKTASDLAHTTSRKNGADSHTTLKKTGEGQNNTKNILPEGVNKTVDDPVAQAKTEKLEDKIGEEGKKSIFDEIAEQEEEEVVAQAKESKWSAGPSIAPVYYNAIGEGSPVHSIFVPNSKSGDINLSYGLAVSYEISKKLSVKTGVHKVNYGYDTNDIEFSSSLESLGNGQIENIDYSRTARNIIVESGASNTNSFKENAALDAATENAPLNGVMAQQFGYLEIPLELNYSILNRKFGINLIGGFSSLFLMDNSVTLTSGELTAEMGEANNVNNVNFSTNIGFGVNYKFSQKIQLNVEPVFKYQLNTFSETSGDFKPYTIGVYSGLSFKF